MHDAAMASVTVVVMVVLRPKPASVHVSVTCARSKARVVGVTCTVFAHSAATPFKQQVHAIERSETILSPLAQLQVAHSIYLCFGDIVRHQHVGKLNNHILVPRRCLLYTSDAADDM
eukprot:15001842-Alexandrium_andersonii.AAC.1